VSRFKSKKEMAKKTWQEKFDSGKSHEILTTDKDFADIPAGSKILIATPKIIYDYVAQIPEGYEADVKKIRRDLASEYGVEYTCPVTTGIFLRIAAEVAHEEIERGKSLEEVMPFWRVINKKSTAAKKLTFGYDFIKERREAEGLSA